VPVVLRVDERVGDDVVQAVRSMLRDLGITNVTTR